MATALDLANASQEELQDMLGEALGELEYVRINQLLGHKALKILQRKASLAVRRAKDCALSSSSSQVEQELQAQLLAQDFQLSKARLETFNWKRRAAILQLKLDSQQEDAMHLQSFQKVLATEMQHQHEASKEKESQHSAVLEELQQSKAALASQQQALQEVGLKLQDAKQAAGSSEAATEKQLHAAQLCATGLKLELQEALRSKEACERQASAAEAKSQQSEAQLQAAIFKADAAEKEVEAAKKEAKAAKEEAEATAKVALQAAQEGAAALQSHLRDQVDELKNLIALQRAERQASEQNWKERTKIAEEELRGERARREVMQAQLDARSRVYFNDDAKENSASPSDAAEKAMDLVATYVGNDKASGSQDTAAPFQRRDAPGGNAAKTAKARDPWDLQPSPPPEHKKPQQAIEGPTSPHAAAPPQEAGQKAAIKKKPPPAKEAKSNAAAPMPSRETQVEGGKRPVRKSRSSQPYWIVSTATDGASPATASPTPSAADLEDTEDPSFSAELPAVKAGGKSKARPEAMDKENIPSAKRAKKSGASINPVTANVSAREEEQEPAVEVQEAAHMPAETSRTASSEEALVGKDGQEAIVAKRRSRAQSKAGGRKSRLGPHGGSEGAEQNQSDGAQKGLDAMPPPQNTATAAADLLEAGQAAEAAESRRPEGISKIDLRDVWGGRTPATSPEAAAAEQPSQLALPEKQVAAVIAEKKAVRPGSRLEADPLKAINKRVVEAAAQRKQTGQEASQVQLGTRRSQMSQPSQAGIPSKRKLQPPSILSENLPRDLLLAPAGGFKIPRLKKLTSIL